MSATPPTGGPEVEKDAICVRQPPLRLIYPVLDLDRLVPITEDHLLYPVAAAVYYLAPGEPRDALLAALAESWPRSQGRRPDVDSLHTYLAVETGASHRDAAAAWVTGDDAIRKRVDRFRERQVTLRDHLAVTPDLVPVTGEMGSALLDVMPDLIAAEPRRPRGLGRPPTPTARAAEHRGHSEHGPRQRAAVKAAADRLVAGNPQIAADALADELHPDDVLHFHQSADGGIELAGTGADDEFTRRRRDFWERHLSPDAPSAPTDSPPPDWQPGRRTRYVDGEGRTVER